MTMFFLIEGGISMYKLANFIDPVLQKIVSRQILDALDEFSGGWTGNSPDRFCTETIVESHYPQYIVLYGEEKAYDFFIKKIKKMMEELRDTENEYTFDMLGYNIIYKALEDINDFWGTPKEDIKPWAAHYTVSASDKEHLKELLRFYLENEYQDMVKEYKALKVESGGEFQESINENFVEEEMEILLARITDGSKYIYEITGADNSQAYFEFLFRDHDFMLIDEYSLEKINFLISAYGEQLGLIEAGENLEESSGSYKTAIAC